MASMADKLRGLNETEEPVKVNMNFKNIVIVDNLPKVDSKKCGKLEKVIRKIFGGYGKIPDDGFHMAVSEDGGSLGYAFIEYDSVEMAAKALKEGDGKKLDAKHKLRVNFWDDFEKYENYPEEYVAPAQDENNDKTNLTHWLMDEKGRDQFVVRFGTDTHVFWNDPHRQANTQGRALTYDGAREKDRGKNWTEQYVAWSSHGRYLATFHKQGIALWGGEDFVKLGRFAHTDVSYIDFSPNEKYLVTSNGKDRKSQTDPYCIQVWDIRSKKLLRGFDRGQSKGGWPAFKWSADDKYIARATPDTVSVYEVPTMGLLDKKSFKIPMVQECLWHPTDNILAYWIPEKDNIPAKVALLEIPSRKILREKHLYNVQDVKLHWQAGGDYLCVKLARRKTKKTIVHNFEIFRMRQKNIPVEVLELEDNIVAFAWEPVGSRFAIIHGNPARPNVSVYVLQAKKLKLLKTLENRPANCLYWSPTGDYLVCAGLGDKNGWLEFINMNDMDYTTQTEHHMCTDVEWDPSGRFVISSVTQPLNVRPTDFRATMENGYILWSGSGQQLTKVPVDPCYQVLWRPRPKSLLSKEDLTKLTSILKEKYWKKFEEEDNQIKQSQLSGEAKERADWKSNWRAFRDKCADLLATEADERRELRGGYHSDDEDDFVNIEKVTEEEISVQTVDAMY